MNSTSPTFQKINFSNISDVDIILKKSRIDIWQFNLDNPFEATDWDLLSEDEQARANRFHFAHHRHYFIMGRARLRQILSHYLKQSANSLQFEYQAQGKPYLCQTLLEFNLSHSKSTALLAVGFNHSLGIDLEFFSARPYEGIGQHLFSREENETLKALSPSLKALAFFHIWAQKEAFIKAIGLGLSYPTQDITLPLLPKTRQIVFDKEQNQSWKIFSFMPSPACCAAVCYHPDVQDIRYFHLN